MRNMPLKSLWKIVEHIKMDYEEWGGEPQIDETSLYRHVEEMLDLEREPPVSAPAEIVEQCVGEIVDITWSIIESTEPPTAADWARVSDIAEAQAAATRTARAAEIRTATFLENIHQPAMRTATTLSSTRCLGCDASMSSSSCRPCPDPRSRVE
jgi:hypothetical protein